jgi:hypothetical protein
MLGVWMIEDFERNGCLVLKGNGWLRDHIYQMRMDIAEVARAYGLEDPFSKHAPILPDGPARTVFYRSLRYLPSLSRLATSHHLIEIVKSLGLKTPLLMNASNIRMDEGGNNPHRFEWHQDYTYLLGSANSITFWIPFQDISNELGGLEYVPGSHRSGLFDFHAATREAEAKAANLSPKDIVLDKPPDVPGRIAEMSAGEMMVFSQFLLHRSHGHHGTHTRWTAQIRYSDASDQGFADLRVPMGDNTTIFKRQDVRSTFRQQG